MNPSTQPTMEMMRDYALMNACYTAFMESRMIRRLTFDKKTKSWSVSNSCYDAVALVILQYMLKNNLNCMWRIECEVLIDDENIAKYDIWTNN